MWQSDSQVSIPLKESTQQNAHFHFLIVSKKSPRIMHIKKVQKVWLGFKAKLSNSEQSRQLPKENQVVVMRRMEIGCESGKNKRYPLHAPVSIIQSILGPVCRSFIPLGPTLCLFSKIIFECQVQLLLQQIQRAILNNLCSSSVVSHEQKKQTLLAESDLARSHRKRYLLQAQPMLSCLIIMS